MKKVSPQQIEELYNFVRRHYVEYYDVQTELVDHLANGIEQHWCQFPDESFEIALQKEFQKFGIFGFSDIVDKKMATMNKQYNRLIFNQLVKYFTIPKIVISVFIALSIYTILNLFSTKMDYIILVMNIFMCVVVLFLLFKNGKRYKQKTEKKLLFLHIINGASMYGSFFYIPFQIQFLFYKDLKGGMLFCICYSLFFTIFLLYSYLVYYYIPKFSEKFIKEVYPDYQLVI